MYDMYAMYDMYEMAGITRKKAHPRDNVLAFISSITESAVVGVCYLTQPR